MTRMLSVLAGASLLALAGAANAGEPVTLTSAQMDDVTAGTYCCSLGFNVNINKNIKSGALFGVTAFNLVYEANAEADATASALGPNGSFANTFTDSNATDLFGYHSSSATSVSISAAQ